MVTSTLGLKELRENTDKYIARVKKGESFVVMRRSRPVFRISSPDENEDLWEEVVDFTKIRKGGIPVAELLSRL